MPFMTFQDMNRFGKMYVLLMIALPPSLPPLTVRQMGTGSFGLSFYGSLGSFAAGPTAVRMSLGENLVRGLG